jgi:co-chaperonin GroES (HSP10)
MSSVNFAPAVKFDMSLEEAFPAVDPGLRPYGSRVLVQIRSAKKKTKGGIILSSETQETVAWNTQVAKVVGLGPLAFHNREKMTPWPEGAWCKEGDYVRIPKFGGDKFEVPHGPKAEGAVALFALFNDLDILGAVTCDPLEVIAFV